MSWTGDGWPMGGQGVGRFGVVLLNAAAKAGGPSSRPAASPSVDGGAPVDD